MKPVERVIAERASELLSVEGVVGVYEGRTADGGDCIQVAVAVRTPQVVTRIPTQIDGFPVVIVHTGPIGPR